MFGAWVLGLGFSNRVRFRFQGIGFVGIWGVHEVWGGGSRP